MKYTIDKNYSEFMREIALEQRMKKHPNVSEEVLKENIERDIKNNKKELKKILKPLGMDGILMDKTYEKNFKKIFPINFQILCKVLLLQERSKKDNLVYQIKHENFEDINKAELVKILKLSLKEFDNWFENLEYEPSVDTGRSKEELDDIYFELEEQMWEDETTEYIEELQAGEEYNEHEVEYLKNKFLIRQQQNVYENSIWSNIENQIEILKIMKKVHNEIDERVKKILDFNSTTENMILLKNYKSELLGDFPIPQIFHHDDSKAYELNIKDKRIALEELYLDIIETLNIFSESVKCFIEDNTKNDFLLEDSKIHFKNIKKSLLEKDK